LQTHLRISTDSRELKAPRSSTPGQERGGGGVTLFGGGRLPTPPRSPALSVAQSPKKRIASLVRSGRAQVLQDVHEQMDEAVLQEPAVVLQEEMEPAPAVRQQHVYRITCNACKTEHMCVRPSTAAASSRSPSAEQLRATPATPATSAELASHLPASGASIPACPAPARMSPIPVHRVQVHTHRRQSEERDKDRRQSEDRDKDAKRGGGARRTTDSLTRVRAGRLLHALSYTYCYAYIIAYI
jgi:hypothetical protein